MTITAAECPVCRKNANERSSWPEGPWKIEPDFVELRHAGLPCILHRGGMGAWCGYVGLPPGHPLHGKGCHDIDGVSVHGGLTYANPAAPHIGHVPLPGESDNVHWIGFDCAHGGDYCPPLYSGQLLALTGMDGPGGGEHYWTLQEVRAETEQLAEQVAALVAAR